MVELSSWGRLSYLEHTVYVLSSSQQMTQEFKKGPGIACGMRRSYGDVCLNPNGTLWDMTGLDRFIHFDESNGRIVCEAGVLLGDIQRLVIPRGWILPVTPGTQFVTVGGAIANDVHGKNHHICGSFGNHVLNLKIAQSGAGVLECGPQLEPGLFAATIGGLGLTGIIVEAEIQLRRVTSPWLDTEMVSFENLDEFFILADSSESSWEYTLSWVDSSSKEGRGIFFRGNPTSPQKLSEPQQKKWTVPFTPPISLVNRLSVSLFNKVYFNFNKRRFGHRIVHYEPFFYPLDNLLEWNRMYGPHGFFQYQCVIPREGRREVTRELWKEISRSGEGSFLTVLKTFGTILPVGMLSFPQAGITLAVDFPNRGDKTLKLFERLDAIVSQAGGRIYMAKDARMSRVLFEKGYPRLNEFLPYRDPDISSEMSRRLMGY